eukprot:Blabericola_migrator_1__960@NODE_123_length_13376_cov_72_514539_g109_i0_p6_GENE_NODE_123_length_13376_cov_72_514539_g109_i0NODE_123_length_13376_cov_72_514539_g109_i0_p6_ORF_typecomplete_len264_score12_60_NODE_123_length_13376_cov_72_514539_g109_i085599350
MSLKQIFPYVLPFLPARMRLHLADRRWSHLSLYVNCPRMEREAMMEYLKYSRFSSINDVWSLPVKAHIRAHLSTWHSVCAVTSRRWRVSRLQDREFASYDHQYLIKEEDVWDRVADMCSAMHQYVGEDEVILLLRSGFPPDRLMQMPPLDVIYWCKNIPTPQRTLPPLSDVMKFIEPEMAAMSVHTFFTWKYATQCGKPQDLVDLRTLHAARVAFARTLMRETFPVLAKDAGFSAYEDGSCVLFQSGHDTVILRGKESCKIKL